jgi:hypothetical protein
LLIVGNRNEKDLKVFKELVEEAAGVRMREFRGRPMSAPSIPRMVSVASP